jgi:PII-like signaling protein
MTTTIHRRRIEVLADEPLVPAIVRIAAEAGITHYTLLPTLGGAGAHGRWRDDQLSGATAKVLLLLITSTEHAQAFIDRLAPLLESHHMMLLCSDVEVVRGAKFD